MRPPRHLAVLCALVPALLLPASAEAACGVPAARAEYETPEVQVYVRKGELVACHRATGKARVVGYRSNDGMGTDEYTAVMGVVGGRWVWTSLLATFAESADVREDTLTDLRTGKKVKATVWDEDTNAQAFACRARWSSAATAGSPRCSPTGASRCSSPLPPTRRPSAAHGSIGA